MTTDLIGTMINQYRLDEHLGDGGMGTVFKSYDTNLDRIVALKLMHPHFARQPEFRERLKQEARTAAQLEHPSIIRIYDFGDSDEGLYITMEYVDGGSLRSHLQRLHRLKKQLPIDQALQIGAQIAEALDYAHKHSMVHRDVKPGNIILKRVKSPEQDGEYPFRAMLTDFGLVKVTESSLQTQTGLTMGTPIYMSPEQCQGDELDGRSDLYSLGVVLYELITNKPSFQFKSLSEALATHIRGDLPSPPSDLRPDTPPLIDAIIMRMLAKETHHRFEDGTQVANVLRSAMYSMSDSPTRVIRRAELEEQLLRRAADQAPQGFHMQIEAENRTATFMPLVDPIITIGRGADNDMVLPIEGVSRNHARLQAMEYGWAIVDLGGVNGTYMDGRRLNPNEVIPIPIGSRVEIGPYELTLESVLPPGTEREEAPAEPLALTPTEISPPIEPEPEPEPALIPVEEQKTQPPIAISAEEVKSEPALIPVEEPEPEEVEDPLGLFITRERIAAEPGRPVDMEVEVINRSDQDDRVGIRIQGIPADWITLSDGFIDLPANESKPIKFVIRVPRRPDTPIGRQKLLIELVSQRNPDTQDSASASLLITAYKDFDIDIDPKECTLPETVLVHIQNRGNTAENYQISLNSTEDRVRIGQPLGPIRVAPGRTGSAEVHLEPANRQLFGSSYTRDYDLRVTSESGDKRTTSGEATIKALLPSGVGYLIGVVVTVAVIMACVTTVLRSDALATIFGANATPTQTAFLINTATPTFDAAANEATQVAATSTAIFEETRAFITPSPTIDANDRDGDRLSDSQESIVGTNPNNPDSDEDGLSDGDEAFTFGTNPLNPDTDGDILRDGDEVEIYKTDPKNADTDGDGVNDGTEVSQNQNPLDGNPSTATPEPSATHTSTPIPDTTATATNTPEPGAPTETPAPTATETATAAPATETATVVPPTETATVESPTATAEPSPTTEQATETPPTAEPTAQPTQPAAETPVATIDPETAADPALLCVVQAPTLDGSFDAAEWGGSPIQTLQSPTNPNRVVEIYTTRDQSNLYVALIILGQANSVTETIRVYVDTVNDGADPDIGDRYFQVVRDGASTLRVGIGTTDDNEFWNDASPEQDVDWQAASSGISEDVWVVELQVSLASQLQSLADPFGMGVQVGYSGEIISWPENIVSNDANGWADVINPTCQ